ncbi:unnamed protein product, partial [Mesorhabditis spiculigera]
MFALGICTRGTRASGLLLKLCSRRLVKFASTSASLQPLSSLSDAELGPSILWTSKNLPPGSTKTPHELISRGVLFAKSLSLASSVVGAAMLPVLSSYLWEAAQERPATMALAIVANGFLVLLSFTPFLLHFLAKRFPIEVHYNEKEKIVTTIHYDFFLRKRALRFKPEDVVDAAIAPEMKKVWLPLATVFVKGFPLLLSLDRRQYADQLAFLEITKNVNIPPDHD